MVIGFVVIKGEELVFCIFGYYLFNYFIIEKGFIVCLIKVLEDKELCFLDYFFILLLNRVFIIFLKLF